jgi:hypothetical protein
MTGVDHGGVGSSVGAAHGDHKAGSAPNGDEVLSLTTAGRAEERDGRDETAREACARAEFALCLIAGQRLLKIDIWRVKGAGRTLS